MLISSVSAENLAVDVSDSISPLPGPVRSMTQCEKSNLESLKVNVSCRISSVIGVWRGVVNVKGVHQVTEVCVPVICSGSAGGGGLGPRADRCTGLRCSGDRGLNGTGNFGHHGGARHLGFNPPGYKLGLTFRSRRRIRGRIGARLSGRGAA